MPSLGITLPTAVGDLRIYVNPTQQAKATNLLKSMPQILTSSYEEAAFRFGERLARMAKSCLRNGMPPRGSGVSWPPHAESTIKQLGEHTLLYWSSQYYHAIGVRRRGRSIYVGVPSSTIKTRPDGKSTGGISLSNVAKILEYGDHTGKIPPRPLWIPLFESAGGKEKFKSELVKTIRNKVRRYIV